MTEKQFLKMSSLTPLVNVDLLITNENKEVLFAWRDDLYCGTGWHIPGGIIRNGEMRAQRLLKTAQAELGVIPVFEEQPIAVNEIILKQKFRNHFISFLYHGYIEKNKIVEGNTLWEKPRQMKWFGKCPKNLIFSQAVYQIFLEKYFLHEE